MKAYALILFLFIISAVCFAHTEITHKHKASIVGHNPHSDGNYDYTHDGVSKQTVDGVRYYVKHTHQLSNHHIGGWKHPGYGDPKYYENPPKKEAPEKPLIPINSPTQHSGCYGSGAEHFHRLDGNNYGHGLDHSGHVFVSGVLSGIHRHPACETDGEKNLPDDPFENTEDKSVGASVFASDDDIKDDTVAPTSIDGFTGLPQPRVSLGTLRITHLSYDDGVLTLQLTAYSPSTAHNHLVIRVNEQDFITPTLFFGRFELTTDEIRQVSFAPHTNGRSVILTRSEYSRLVNGKAHTVSARTQGVVYGWDSITDFDIENFVVRLRNYASETDRDIVRHTDIDADGNRIGSVGGAPSLSKPKLVTVWAALKRQ